MTTVGDIVDQANQLADTDEWDEAINLLTAANRRQRSDQIEIALTDIRHRSWSVLTGGRGPSDDPAAVSPPIGPSGLPETSVADLDGAGAWKAITEHGSLLVRRALDQAQIGQLIDAVDHSFAASNRPDAGTDGDAWFHPLAMDAATAERVGPAKLAFPRKFAKDAGGVLLVDSPRAMFALLELYEQLGLYEVVSNYVGGRPAISANKCTLRLVPLDAVGGWHQDGAFLGRDIKAINIWLTLSPCGVDAPGLDVIGHRLDDIIETGTGGAAYDWAVGDEVVDALGGVVRPQFEAGDMLLFDEMNLHRTAMAPGMTRPRYAIEFWCFSAARYPDNNIMLTW
ncbi:MAG: phytanoyl-CoA dioxygenase family protein [Acidimicrobiia bacterium]|nr:phytanoyl-CoA dioxygenase family protein [Acidimicrobiia bacterium]